MLNTCKEWHRQCELCTQVERESATCRLHEWDLMLAVWCRNTFLVSIPDYFPGHNLQRQVHFCCLFSDNVAKKRSRVCACVCERERKSKQRKLLLVSISCLILITVSSCQTCAELSALFLCVCISFFHFNNIQYLLPCLWNPD